MASRFSFVLLVVISPISLTSSFVTGDFGADEAAALKTCWNTGYNSTPVSFMEWTSGHPARLYMVDAWWSRRDSGIPLTMFTMASIDRISMLESQCRDYLGPLSAAVYVPLVLEDDLHLGSDFASSSDSISNFSLISGGAGNTVTAAREKLQALFNKMEFESAPTAAAAKSAASSIRGRNSSSSCCCQLRLMLFAERLTDRTLAAIMPTNAMRNAAMLGATTPLSGMLDADLGISARLNDHVQNETWLQWVRNETSGASKPHMVIPTAWESTGNLSQGVEDLLVKTVLTGNKTSLVTLWDKSLVQPFQVDVCARCHGLFNHSKWAVTGEPYSVKYKPEFEPWGLISRLLDPGYDERFRGWLYDKQMHVEALAHKHGFQLTVVPDVWFFHRPHKKVPIAQIVTKKGEAVKQASKELQAMLKTIKLDNGALTNPYKLYRLYVDNLRNDIRNSLAAHKWYEPQLNQQYLHCKSVLPWWTEQ